MEELLKFYNERKEIINNRLNDFSRVNDEDYFYEMCFCLLTPQSSAKAADKCIKELKMRDFRSSNFNPEKFLTGVRFNVNKAKYLVEAKSKYTEIFNVVKNIKDTKGLREWLVKNVKGYGYKESSHFLRNIGCRGLTILDRHILKNLKKFNVIDEVPNPLTKKKYLEIENKFIEFSKRIGISIDELDLLFWSMETGEVFK